MLASPPRVGCKLCASNSSFPFPLDKADSAHRLKGSANRGTLRCDTCNEHFPDFNYSAFVEHNWEIHTRHPSELLFCPVGTCDVSTFVSRSAQMDDHLANNHQIFCNMAGRGGDYLENTTDPSLLSHLNRAAALYVLAEDCLKAEAILEEKARLLKKAQHHNVTLRALEREFLSDLAPDSPDINEVYMTKAEVVEIIVKLREEMKEWYSSFVQVEDLLERRMNGDNVEDHQDMKNDSTSTRARTSSLRKRRRADRKVP